MLGSGMPISHSNRRFVRRLLAVIGFVSLAFDFPRVTLTIVAQHQTNSGRSAWRGSSEPTIRMLPLFSPRESKRGRGCARGHSPDCCPWDLRVKPH